MSNTSLTIKHCGKQEYDTCFNAMLQQTLQRIDNKKNDKPHTNDELWLVEHPSVYTLGQAADAEHILNAENIPVVKTDRGGQVTWHGEGQLVAYFLFDLAKLSWHVRQLVTIAEESICELLTPYLRANLIVKARKDAPGVYVFEQKNNQEQQLGKIASLGFKIKRGFSYHGIAININADMSPFANINPCGYAGMTMLNLTDVAKAPDSIILQKLQQDLVAIIQSKHSV